MVRGAVYGRRDHRHIPIAIIEPPRVAERGIGGREEARIGESETEFCIGRSSADATVTAALIE